MSAGRSDLHDAVVIGAGHNGLVAATLLARAGWRVVALERSREPGGAAVSVAPFPGQDVRLSRYSYLVSLFPRVLLAELGVGVELRRRRVSSYTPWGEHGVLVCDDAERTRRSLLSSTGEDGAAGELERFAALTARVAPRIFGSMLEPLRSRAEFERLVDDDAAWESLFERPLSEVLEQSFADELVRGIVATDALIGTFAALDDPELRQNRCFLYHVVGNGTGRWDVPVGGMGALSGALAGAAVRAGAQLRLGAEVTSIEGDAETMTLRLRDGGAVHGRHVLCGAAPSVLSALLGERASEPAPEGAQLKLNLLLARLPRLRDPEVAPEDAFAGTLHVNESYEQLRRAFAQARSGRIPELPPCEAYCHSLTDPSILSRALREAGAHTLTVFGLHMPARLFASDPAVAKRDAVTATLRSIDSVLGEPIEECLLHAADGEPCLEARTPLEIEEELAMPGGHIFHRDLSWPFAEREDEVGRWGVETSRPNVWLCGAGARRGGGVSGIPGRNAARAVLEADRLRRGG